MKRFFTTSLCILIFFVGMAQNSGVMKQVVVAEYRSWFITQDGKVWSWNNSSPLPVQYSLGGLKADTGAGGFNYFRILDEQGYVWTSTQPYVTSTARLDKDTTGAAFSGNWYIDAYGDETLTIRADSSIWLFGKDIYSMFYPGGQPLLMTGVNMAPTKLSPAGMKFKKALFGGGSILALTTSGQVYQWTAGAGRTPKLISTVRPASDIFISHLNAAGCIIPDAGDNSGMGYPYIWGGTGSMWGGTNSTTPVSVKALWNMTSPIKEISMDWNTIHYIDALGNMYGCGFNSFGEVGNGQEFLNKYNYPGFPGYGWTLVDYENPSGVPVQIGKGVKWKHIYSNNWFGFYKFAMDQNDSIYSWGRNKGLVLGNGYFGGYNASEYHPNDLDVLKPTMVHPFSSIYTEYGFIPPSISADPKQVVTTSTATLTAKAQAPLLIAARRPAANGKDTVGYWIVSYQWTKVSGPASGTITTPNATKTTVTNLSAGTYIFNLLTTDNNTGTLSVNDTVIVTSTAPGTITVNAGSDQSITLPTSSATLTGTASQVNGSIVSYKWTQVSGPSTASITNAGLAQTAVTGLVQGVYKFQLLVTTALGTTAVATVQITVNATAPGQITVSAGPNQIITLPTSSVTLSGSASQVNGTIKSYQWTQVSGPNTATIANAAGVQASATGLVQGVYKFQLLATTVAGTSASATIQVTVNAAVGPVVVSAGSSQTIALPTNSITLTGSASQANGSIASYKWTQVSGPNTAGITSSAQASTTVTGLVQGSYTFQLLATSGLGATATATTTVTVNAANGKVIPGTIQAENYDYQLGIGLAASTDAGGGQYVGNLGYIGNQVGYNTTVTTAGTYTVSFRVASPATGAIFKLMDAQNTTLATVTVPNTGGWQIWTTVNATVTLPAGAEYLKLVTQNAVGWNFNWMQFDLQTTTPPPSGKVIPGTIQAESYDGQIGIGLASTTDVGGGQYVGNLGYVGNQVAYYVTVAKAATYTASFRVATPATGAVFQVLDTKNALLATVSVPNTGGWQVWTTVSTTVSLPAGTVYLKIVNQNTNGWNFNWMSFVEKTTTTAVVRNTAASDAAHNILVGAADSAATDQPAHFNVYPNPAIDQVTLDIANGYTGRLDVQVINISGIVVRRFELNKGLSSMQSTISLSGLTPGVYVIRVSGATGWSTTSKLLKK